MFFRPALLSAVLLIFTACSRSPSAGSGVERLAIVSFDNLTGDPSLNWMGRAIAEISAARTAGHATVQTFAAPTIEQARNRYATQTVSGSFVRAGNELRLVATLRDENAQRNIRTFESHLEVGNALAGSQAVAQNLQIGVRPYTTMNAVAIREYFQGVTSLDPQQGMAHIDRALAADPRFGAAWLARLTVLRRSGNAEAVKPALQALATAELTPGEKATVSAFEAELRGDPLARVKAVEARLQASPGDIDGLRALANQAIEARHWPAVIAACERALELQPNDEAALNLRGYAWAYAGDETRSRAAFAQYRERLPQNANAVDSLGEVLFYFRKYDEAGKLFLEAQRMSPGIVNGAEHFRAALSRYLAGDLSGADGQIAGWTKAPVQLGVWRVATGRDPGALPDTPVSKALKSLDLLKRGDRAGAAAVAMEARQRATNPAEASVASVLMLVAQPSASADDWRRRIQVALPAERMDAQRQQLLGWALLLDGKFAEAVPVWQALYNAAPVLASSEQRMALAWALVETGRIEEARKVMPFGFMPPSTLGAGPSILVYGRMPEVLKRLHPQA